MIPGEYILAESEIVALEGRATKELVVENTGGRPIQVGSHFHFFESNKALRFDRAAAFGMRLQIPSGTAVRFEPGDAKKVTLVALAGARIVHGLNGLTEGALSAGSDKPLAAARAQGFQEDKA
jgi:urease subunit gamma/beta